MISLRCAIRHLTLIAMTFFFFLLLPSNHMCDSVYGHCVLAQILINIFFLSPIIECTLRREVNVKGGHLCQNGSER